MKRFIAVVAAVSVAGAVYVATAAGGQHARSSAKQFAALKRQVLGLGKKVQAQGRTIKTLNGELTTLTGELTTLKGQVGTQATTLTTVQGQLSTVQTTSSNDDAFISNCLVAGGVVGVSQYGDPSGTFGYQFQDSSGSSLTSALDVDGSSSPGGYFQLLAPGCISSAGSAARMGGVARESQSSAFRAAKH